MIVSLRTFASSAAGLPVFVGLMLLAMPPAAAQAQTPASPGLPPATIQVLDQANCQPAPLSAAIVAAITSNPASAVDVVMYATQHCPDRAAAIAADAAQADPTDTAAIVVAVISVLPPDQAEIDLAGIVVAVEAAVPGSADQITSAIGQLTFNQGPGLQGRGDKGAPLIAPWTDVPNARITSNSPI